MKKFYRQSNKNINFAPMKTIIQPTADGSHTLFAPEIGENYHSQHGARQESEHIFINAGFCNCAKAEIAVFEVGFGTGLNAILTLAAAEKSQKVVDYKAIDLFPINLKTALRLNYFEKDIYRNYFEIIHQTAWNRRTAITDFFYLTKIKADFTTFECDFGFDVCYFDAFSPEKQADMWQLSRFEMLYRAANKRATLTTYCAKGQVRRDMQAAGFDVERLAGPAGKREILRATKFSLDTDDVY
ncbi:MAG: tRNA (5-methylaminomethyl-2-thiouridine)(34)-methyltransferase MnmD [Prevotellaceae bacterium]|jgi:tRNA U34 5-methylaminomethyl-2-thiouridine-forming methyltransferase MnmC|nr:tRNA (5-methylaminomethyl-2-thiouridine)(34)-methyltransferase MnmD [Prevotellaceae bacterium]